MSRKSSPTPGSANSSDNLRVEYVQLAAVRPNPWNPNRQDDFIYQKELASIRTFGFKVPVIVREAGAHGYQIVDGEHRWKAAGDLGMLEIPVINLGPIDDDDAKQLTIVLNETRGRAQPELLRELLKDLNSRAPMDQLLKVLPYTTEQFTMMLGNFSWDSIERPKPAPSTEKWVMRSYRLPVDAAEVIDRAISKVQDDGSCPDWQALESICADFLA